LPPHVRMAAWKLAATYLEALPRPARDPWY
jgi:hypothetical protein